MTRPSPVQNWPPGGGDVAGLLRGRDWAGTPLGHPQDWPERLKAVVEMMLESPLCNTLVCGPRRLLLYNDAAARLYGDRHPGVFGLPLEEAFPDSFPAVRALYDRAFAGEAVRMEAQPLDVSDAGGEVFESYLTPIRDEGGTIIAVHMVGFEVGRRLAAEAALRESHARQAFLLQLSDEIRALADPAEIGAASSRLLGRHLGLDGASYGLVEPGGNTLVITLDREPPLTEERHDLSKGWPQALAALREGRPLAVGDTEAEAAIDAAERSALAQLGVRAWAAVPLRKDGALVAVTLLWQARPRPWTADEILLAQEVGQRAWDAAERATTEAELRRSEDGFRAIVETARDYAIFTSDAEGRIATWPQGAQAVFGWSADEALGQMLDMTFTPEDRLRGVPRRERQQAAEEGHAPDVRWHLRKDGTRVFVEGSARPLTGPGGEVTGFVKVGQDATQRRSAQEALLESEERFRQFGDASGDVLWIRDARTLAFEYVSPAFEEIYGSPLEHLLGGNQVRRWAEIVLPEDREAALDGLRRVREGEHMLQTFRIRRADGEVRWVRDTSFPLLDRTGQVQRLAGFYHDATEEVAMQERLRVLVAELQHRTRNLIGVVRGVAERTRATSATLEEFHPRFLARMDALGRVNALLSRLRHSDRIDLDQLLRTELAAHGVTDEQGQGPQVTLSGPMGVRLRSAPVQTFALVIHELAANAIEHGALSRPHGRIEVSWAVETAPTGERRLRLDWQESWTAPEEAGAGPVAPLRMGHGRQLIERALPYQIGARTEYELGPEGLRCTILAPAALTLDEPFTDKGPTMA